MEKEKSGWELVRFGAVALGVAIILRLFVAQPFVVSGSSMFPTFNDKNYLIVDEISYRFSDPERSDVVIFRYPKDPKKFFIKRIIGLPNETVDINNNKVTIINEENPEGFVLTEPYVHEESTTNDYLKLKSDEYYVMGDNRGASSDSRVWDAVPRNLIVGRAFMRLWPLKNISMFPGQYIQDK